MVAIDMHVTARYVPFGHMCGVFFSFVCAGVRVYVRGSSGISHDDSLKPRLYSFSCRYFVGTCLFDKGATRTLLV